MPFFARIASCTANVINKQENAVKERTRDNHHDGRANRLSLREVSDWRQLSRTRRSVPDSIALDVEKFEIERLDVAGIVGYHWYPHSARQLPTCRSSALRNQHRVRRSDRCRAPD